MTTRLNEIDRYLVENWSQCLDLCRQLEALRKKHRQLLERVLNRLMEESWWESDFVVYPYADKRTLDIGELGFGRRSWSARESRSNFAGLWLDGLHLENLLDEDGNLVSAYVWIKPMTSSVKKLKRAAEMIRSEGTIALRRFPKRSLEAEDYETPVSYDIKSKGPDPLESALRKCDGDRFVEVVVKHLNLLATLIPAIDKAYLSTRRG